MQFYSAMQRNTLTHMDSKDIKNLSAIVEKLLQRRDELQLKLPFCIAQLRISDEDCNWLFKWVKNIPQKWLNRILTSTTDNTFSCNGQDWSGDILLGFILLVAFSEYSRRHFQDESDNAFWERLRPLFSKSAGEMLIPVNNRYQLLGGALKGAAKHVGLLHRFDDKANQYYSTIFAQFGITRSYVINNLRQALSGANHNRAIPYLLKQSTGLGSFSEFWSICNACKKGERNEEQTKAALLDNGWIPEKWHQEIIERCSRRSRLVNDLLIAPTALSSWQEFLHSQRLCWDINASPSIEFHIDASKVNLEGNEDATIYVNQKELGGLLRLANSTDFEQTTESYVIDVQDIQPISTVSIKVDEDGVQQDCVCWDDTALISMYDLYTGKALDIAQPLLDNHPIALITPADLYPSCSCNAARSSLGTWQLWRIEKNDISQLSIVDEGGSIYWVPTLDKPSNLTDEPWSVKPILEIEQPKNGFLFRIQVLSPQNKSIESVRFGAEKFNVKWTDGVWKSEAILLNEASITPILTVFIKFSVSKTVFSRKIPLPYTGCLIRTGDNNWRKTDAELMDVDELCHSDLRIIMPNKEHFICNGLKNIAHVKHQIQKIKQLDGYGEPLRVVDSENVCQFEICQQVVWHGMIKKIDIDHQVSYSTASIDLRRSTSLEGYRLLVWEHNKGVVVQSITNENSWDPPEQPAFNFQLELPTNLRKPTVLALLYRNECRGVWWDTQSSDIKPDENTSNLPSPQDICILLRYLRLPILMEPFTTLAVEQFSGNFGLLECWLSEDNVTLTCDKYIHFKGRQPDDAWLRAVRVLVHKYEAQITSKLDWKSWTDLDKREMLCTVSPRLAAQIAATLCQRYTTVINRNRKPDQLKLKKEDKDHLIWHADQYLQEHGFAYDETVLRFLDEEDKRNWIVENCLDLAEIEKLFDRAVQH